MNLWDRLVTYLYGNKIDTTPNVIVNEFGTGALVNTRTPEETQTDVHFAEIVATAATVVWLAKVASAWRKFPAFNQASSNACVAFSMAKILGVMRWLKDGVFVTFAGGDIYRRRPNKPGAGMESTAPYAIAAQGVTLEALLPTQNMGDTQIDGLKIPDYVGEVGELFAIQNPKAIVLPIGDIDAVASVIQQTGKAVMVWFYFTSREWGSNISPLGSDFNVPVIMDNLANPQSPASLRHSLAAVDFTMYGGVKALVIEDSAWFGGFNRRIITEDWFRARNFFSAYPMNFKQVRVSNALPDYIFKKSLSFIPWDDVKNAPADPVLNAAQLADVKVLQTILQIMEDEHGNTYLPTNVTATGYYGALTADAVYKWGCDHLLGVVSQSTLDTLGGKTFGSASMSEMNTELV